jgi:asparagine N-glycosylation enzyme membrane subunit Stt3
VAALLLAGVVLAFGPPGALARLGLLGLSGLQPLLCALVAAYAALLAAARARRRVAGRWLRAAEVLVAAAAPLGVALAFSPFRHEAARGVVALVAGNAWYASIDEFQPLLGSRSGIGRDAQFVLAAFGLALLAAAPSLVALAREARRDPEERPARVVLLLWSGLFLALTLASRRFALYLVVPLAVTVAYGAARAPSALARRWPRFAAPVPALLAQAAVYALVLVPALPFALVGESSYQPVRRDVQAQLRWLARQPAPPGREGVLSTWTLGHAVRYFAGRSVVATPFGTEGGEGAMDDTAAFFLGRDERATEDLLRDRQVGHVLLANPVNDWHTLASFVPETPPAIRFAGGKVEFLPGVEDVVTARLFFADGGSTRGAPGLGGFRLVHETPGIDVVDPLRDARVKLFEVVPGARLVVRGLAPGGRATARVGVSTAAGRTFGFETWAIAGDSGAVELRVPYATGANGTSRAAEYEILTDGVTLHARIPERAVRSGEVMIFDVAVGPGGD